MENQPNFRYPLLSMKKIILQSIGAVILTGTWLSTHTATAQRVEVTSVTTTSDGTVSEFGPQSILIKTAPGFQPIRYISSETTNYVDEEGNPVAANLVKSGLPVTVYYTKVGDTLVASKIMVRKAVIVPRTPVISTISSAGTVSEFGPSTFFIKTESSEAPLRYSYGKTTTYIDEKGAPVSMSIVKSGVPVTVYYTKVGDTLMANKIIVKSAVEAPIIEEKTTTTTTTTKQ